MVPRSSHPEVVEAGADVVGAGRADDVLRQEPGSGPLVGPLAVAITGEDWLQAICPFLRAADGSWRSAGPAREHRCWATEPPSELPVLTQQRLCLVKAHDGCERFLHARELRSTAVVRERAAGGASVVMPVAELAAGPGSRMDAWQGLLGGILALPRAALAVGLAIIAGTLLLAVLLVTGGSGAPVPSIAPPPLATPGEEPGATAVPVDPVPSFGPGEVRRYRVREGDTLRGIADRFGVSVRQIRAINDLGEPPRIEADMVLLIPVAE